MKLVIFTSNAIRHKYLANSLAKNVDEVLVISECKQNDSIGVATNPKKNTLIAEHFCKRYQMEVEYFPGNDFFYNNTLPILHKEANTGYVYDIISTFSPDIAIVFGASIIRDPLLSLIPRGRFINLHLGLSPYYRGSGTNFWPFINNELQYVGATLLHIDAGIDTGDIIAHVTPMIAKGDDVHKVGCKVIEVAVKTLVDCLSLLAAAQELPRIPQWKATEERYYKKSDFNEDILIEYYKALEDGLVERYISGRSTGVNLLFLEG